MLLVVVGPAGPTTTNITATTTLKPEAATAVGELLTMGVRTPETWAVNKRLDNKLEKLLHLIGDLFKLYYDARTSKL